MTLSQTSCNNEEPAPLPESPANANPAEPGTLPSTKPASKQRLQSLDALRGLDMLLIVGLNIVVYALAGIFPNNGFCQLVVTQFLHKQWMGFSLLDLVLPLFVFIAGASMAFSLAGKSADPATRRKAILHLYRRAAILILLGFLVNGTLTWDVQDMRFASVLGLIGICCAIGGTIILLVRNLPWMIGIIAFILGSIACLQFGFGDFTPGGSINALIDQHCLPGHIAQGHSDPEGILCIVSAIALTLIGYVAGTILKSNVHTPIKRFGLLFLSGAALAGIAFVAKGHYPLIKHIWTATFVFTAGGISIMALSLFYLVIDIWKFRAWSFPLQIVGMNAIFAYIVAKVVDFDAINERIFSGFAAFMPPAWSALFLASTYLLLLWLLLFGMYRKGIFIKV